jgi:UTP-glucose-1-phosphate uridylyltransferase
MNEAMAAEMLTVTDSPTVIYTADETIPYCKGIDELLDE